MIHPADLVRAQILEVWGQGNVALVDRFYADTVVDHMPLPGQPSGRAALKDVVMAFRTALPDMAMHLHTAFARDGLAVDVWTLTGTHAGPLFGAPATGRSVRFSGMDMVRVRNGQITDLWHVEDLLTFERQIGLAPGDPGRPDEPVGVVVGDAPEAADPLAWLRAGAPDLQITAIATVAADGLTARCLHLAGRHTAAPLLGCAPVGRRFAVHAMELERTHPRRCRWLVAERRQLLRQIGQ